MKPTVCIKWTYIIPSLLVLILIIIYLTIDFNSKSVNAPHYLPYQNTKKHHKVLKESRWLKTTDKHEIYIFSSFYDDREGLPHHEIRIIAVAEKLVEKRNLFCVYQFKDTNRTTKSSRLEYFPIGAGVWKNSLYFREYVMSCTYSRTDPKPISVTVVTDEFPEPTEDAFLPVEYPFKPKERLPFGVCMKGLYGKQDPYNIVEWMELHRILGTNEVTIYDHSITDIKSKEIYQKYEDEGFVDFRPCPNPFPVEHEPHEQIAMSPSINDCLYRNLFRYNKVQVTDIDEIIVPGPSTKNYTDLIKLIEKETHNRHPASSYVFRNAYFFTDIPQSTVEPSYLMTSRFTKRVEISPPGYSVKSMSDPRVCIALHNHECWTAIRRYDAAGWKIGVPPVLGKSQHYKKCHFDAWLNKPGECAKMYKSVFNDNSALQFQKILEERVKQKLIEFNLIDT